MTYSHDDSIGGVAIPSKFMNEIWSEILESSIYIPRCRIYPMRRQERLIPNTEIDDHNNGNFSVLSGIQMSWESADSDTDEDYKW